MTQGFMEDTTPGSPWEHRLHRVAIVGGWSIEVWNPMTRAWERSPHAPHWPDHREQEAQRWVALANEEQVARNAGARLCLDPADAPGIAGPRP